MSIFLLGSHAEARGEMADLDSNYSDEAVKCCCQFTLVWSFAGVKTTPVKKGSTPEFGVLVQNMWITGLREWGFLHSRCDCDKNYKIEL